MSWKPITAAEARVVAGWRYQPPYDFYNLGEDAIDELLDPAQHYVAAIGEDGALIGFACFGESARVPGGHAAGCYSGPALDLGLGLRPDLTGCGFGAAFVAAVIKLGHDRFQTHTFCFTVAAFNRRAILVYSRIGFAPSGRFTSVIKQRPVEFLVMQTSLTPAAEPDQTAGASLGNPA